MKGQIYKENFSQKKSKNLITNKNNSKKVPHDVMIKCLASFFLLLGLAIILWLIVFVFRNCNFSFIGVKSFFNDIIGRSSPVDSLFSFYFLVFFIVVLMFGLYFIFIGILIFKKRKEVFYYFLPFVVILILYLIFIDSYNYNYTITLIITMIVFLTISLYLYTKKESFK